MTPEKGASTPVETVGEVTAAAMWTAICAIVLFSLLTQLPFFVEPPGRDQSLFLAQAQMISSGGDLYTHVWEHKPPGVIMAYCAITSFLGESHQSILIGNWAAGVVTALLIWLLSIRFGARKGTALTAAFLYLFYFASPLFGGYWVKTQSEVLMDPCIAAALCLLHGAYTERLPMRRAVFLAGTAIAAALFFKYSALPMALVGLPVLLRKRHGAKGALRLCGIYCAGMAWSWLLYIGYLGLTGRLGQFYEANILFNQIHATHANQPLFSRLAVKLAIWPEQLAPFYLFAAVACVAGMASFIRPQNRFSAAVKDHSLMGRGALLLWLLAMVEIFWQRKFWAYHYHVILMPLVLLGATGIDIAYTLLKKKLSTVPTVGILAALLITSLASQAGGTLHYARDHRLIAYLGDQAPIEALYDTYNWGKTDYRYLENLAVARLVKERSNPGDKIFVWGFEPGIYTMSRRAPSSRFLYDYPISPIFGSLAKRNLDLLMKDLADTPPALFLVLQRDTNAIESSDSATQLSQLPPLVDFLERGYVLDWRLGDFTCYRRGAPPSPGNDTKDH